MPANSDSNLQGRTRPPVTHHPRPPLCIDFAPVDDAKPTTADSMNNPLIALVAAVALFMWLWTTEHENRAAHRAARAAKLAQLSNGDAASVTTASAIPLPEGIVPGRFLVSDSLGQFTTIDVTEEQIQAAPLSQTPSVRDFYVAVCGERHWIFRNVDAIARAPIASPSVTVVAFPTGECLEAEPVSLSTTTDGPTAEQWRDWVGNVCGRAPLSWGRRRTALSIDAHETPPGGWLNRWASDVSTIGRRWWRRLVVETGSAEIAAPPRDPQSL